MSSTIESLPVSDITTELEAEFTPEPSCTRDIYYAIFSDASCGDVPCRYFHLGPTTSAEECMPSGWEAEEDYFQSPGACPGGYTIACAESAEDSPETTATCCPSGYECQTDDSLWPWHSTNPCIKVQPATLPFVYTTELSGEDPKTITTSRRSEDTNPTFHAFGVEIRFQPTDVGGTVEPTSTAASNSESESQSGDSSDSGGGGLSKGSVVGIAVGVGAVLVAGLLAAWYIWRRKRASRNHVVEEATPKQLTPEPALAELPTPADRAELMTEYVAPPPLQRKPTELNGDYSAPGDGVSRGATPPEQSK